MIRAPHHSLLGVYSTGACKPRTSPSSTEFATHKCPSLTAIFYRQPGIAYLESPPFLLIPGNIRTGLGTPAADDSSSEEASTSSKRSLPAYMGTTFTFICELWRIVHGFTQRYYNERNQVMEPPRLDFAELKYRELLAWIQKLPAELARGEDNPHHVVVFQYVLFNSCSRSSHR